MWKTEHSVELDVDPAAVWAHYSDVSKWKDWYPDLLEVKLDGPFKTGVQGTLRQDPNAGHHPEPVTFTLTEVVDNERWTIKLDAPTSETGIVDKVVMHSSSEITPKPGGGVRVTHSTTLSGPGAEEIGAAIGQWISQALAQGLEKLTKLVG